MDELIADGVRWRIQQRNEAWSAHKTEVAAVIHPDIAHIIVEYCLGTVPIIPLSAAAKLVHGQLVCHDGHSLSTSNYHNRNIINFQYSRSCSFLDTGRHNVTYRFEWTDVVEFVLTGCNDTVDDEIYWLIKDINTTRGMTPMDNEYIPCCPHGDAMQLAKILLAKLRSSLVGGNWRTQDQRSCDFIQGTTKL